jgi:hypothetical protein
MMKISSAATMAFMVVLLYGCTGARSDMWDPEPVFGGDGGEEGDTADHEASGDIQGDGAPDGEGPGDQPADPEAPFDAPHDVPPDGDVDLCEQPCNDGIDCTIDSCDPARGCIFTPANERCNDGIDCTVDTCNALTGCIFAPVDARCNDAIPCTVDMCLPGTGCVFTPEDALCSDGIDCTLDRCDLSAGACTSTPRHDLCADDVDCTVDRCDPAAGCLNAPDDSLCGPGERCEPDCGGCILDVAPAGRFLAHSSSSLYQIDPAAPSSTAIGDIGFSVTDIAVTEDNMLWGITYDSLLSIDYCTGIGRYVGNVGSTSTLNALVAAPGGVLFGADYSGDVWRIDPATAAGTHGRRRLVLQRPAHLGGPRHGQRQRHREHRLCQGLRPRGPCGRSLRIDRQRPAHHHQQVHGTGNPRRNDRVELLGRSQPTAQTLEPATATVVPILDRPLPRAGQGPALQPVACLNQGNRVVGQAPWPRAPFSALDLTVSPVAIIHESSSSGIV